MSNPRFVRDTKFPCFPIMSDIYCRNQVDAEGMPAGGEVKGVGLEVSWQDGPTKRSGYSADMIDPSEGAQHSSGYYHKSGAFVEDVLHAALQRLQHFQEVKGGRFACAENAEAITKITEALAALRARFERRVKAEVVGTQEGEPTK